METQPQLRQLRNNTTMLFNNQNQPVESVETSVMDSPVAEEESHFIEAKNTPIVEAVNSENKPKHFIEANTKEVSLYAMPDVTGGLNTTVTWKNLSLYLGFYYSLGGQIYNAAEHNRNMFKYTGTTPSPEVIHNMWLHPGDQAIYPRPYNDDYNNARMGNSFYLEDASFIRLQNIRVAYDLPENWIKKLMLKNINIYAFVNNALTWTNYSGFDPEFSTNNPLQVGKDSYRYPRKREYGIGFSANF